MITAGQVSARRRRNRQAKAWSRSHYRARDLQWIKRRRAERGEDIAFVEYDEQLRTSREASVDRVAILVLVGMVVLSVGAAVLAGSVAHAYGARDWVVGVVSWFGGVLAMLVLAALAALWMWLL